MEHASQKQIIDTGQHFVRPIPFKAHRVEGFSPETLEHHYEDIYGAAVRELNDVESQLAERRRSADTGSDFLALKAEELRLANAIALHEVHFDSLGEDGGADLDDEELNAALEASFGSVAAWRDEVVAMARQWRGGSGWIVLA